MSRSLTRRALLRWGALGAGAMVVAACAPQTMPAPAAEKEEPAAAPAAKEEPKPAAEQITLRYMARQGPQGGAMREFAKRFQDESEGRIVVEIEEAPWGEVLKILETQLVSGTMVDLTWGDTAWWPYLATRGAYLVIEPYVEKAGMDVTNWFNLEWFRKWTDGQLSGLGGDAGINHCLAFYNKGWVTEAWGKEPTDDWTMEDYVECMQACAKFKGEGFYGGSAPVGGSHVADGWIRNWGGFYINPEGTESLFHEAKCQDGIRFIREQLANGNYPGREARAEGESLMFLTQKQAITINNPGASQGMVPGAVENGFELGVVLAPKGPSSFETPPRRAFIPYANTNGVYARTEHPQEAFDLMIRVTSNEAQKWFTLETGKQPGSQLDLWYDPDIVARYPWFAKVADLMKECTDAFSMPANTRFNEWRDVGEAEIPPLVFDEVEYNDVNIQQVSDHLQEIIDLPIPGSL